LTGHAPRDIVGKDTKLTQAEVLITQPTIMVVDDCEIVLEVTKHLLEEAGFHVMTRSSARGSTAAILKEQPSCVLMDVSMPALSGTEIVRLIKEKSDIRVL